jgi:probable rRNA maturation factor
LSLLITDDAMVRELNKTYRGVDRSTDVLSFALEADGRDGAATGFVMPPGEKVHLGEVIVSYPKAAKQAAERKHPVEDELALLVVHGVLHLLGYDHDNPDREREMRLLEQRVLSAVRGRAG